MALQSLEPSQIKLRNADGVLLSQELLQYFEAALAAKDNVLNQHVADPAHPAGLVGTTIVLDEQLDSRFAQWMACLPLVSVSIVAQGPSWSTGLVYVAEHPIEGVDPHSTAERVLVFPKENK